MSMMVSQITGILIVCWTICSGADQRKHQTLYHWPVGGRSTSDQWIPLSDSQLCGKCFHLMMSSCTQRDNGCWSAKSHGIMSHSKWVNLPKYITSNTRRVKVCKAVSQWLLTFNLCVSVTWPSTCAFHIHCTYTPEIIDMHRGMCDKLLIHHLSWSISGKWIPPPPPPPTHTHQTNHFWHLLTHTWDQALLEVLSISIHKMNLKIAHLGFATTSFRRDLVKSVSLQTCFVPFVHSSYNCQVIQACLVNFHSGWWKTVLQTIRILLICEKQITASLSS